MPQQPLSEPSPDSSPTIDVVVVPANRALVYWNQAKPIIWPALDTGEMAPETVVKNLIAGDMQLWIAYDEKIIGGALTEVVRYWKVKSLRVIALAGERFEEWREPMDELFERFGRQYGCSRIELYGRKGWSRRLPNYSVKRVMMSRAIDGQE